MKNLLVALLTLVVLVSCDESKNAKQRILPDSASKINHLAVVVDNHLWKGIVGEEIRNIFAAPVDGLPQPEEPLFSLKQMPTQVFSGFATSNRTVLKIEKGAEESGVEIAEDAFARPQTMIIVKGKTDQDIIQQLNENAPRIIAMFKNKEITEKIRRFNISLNKNKSIEEKLGLNIQYPSIYRTAKEEDDFFWIRRDVATGTMDLLIYELPFGTIKRNDSTIINIIKMRDSIGKAHIHGDIEGSYMATERAFSPLLFKTIIDNKPALETKGTWDMKNGTFMAGPFINYIIDDEINDRQIVMEGYVFAPSVQKRDFMFELEAIIKSVKIK